MVFALAGGTYDGDVLLSLGLQVVDGFGLVVRLLVGKAMEDMAVLTAILITQRVSVADNYVWYIAALYISIGTAITADYVGSRPQCL